MKKIIEMEFIPHTIKKEEKDYHWSIQLLIIIAFVAIILAMWIYKI